MTLETNFSSKLAVTREVAGPDYLAQIRSAAHFLEMCGASNCVKQMGEIAPDFVLTGRGGKRLSLSHLLKDGPVVLSFFRGEWCPFCRVELRALLDAHLSIADQGATLLLLSPQPPSQELAAEIAALGDKIWIVQDLHLGVALAFGLVYLIPAALRQYYLDTDFDIPNLFGSGSWLMPLPADFVIGPDGRIALSYADVDFTVRLDPAILVETLSRLRD